MPEITDHAVLRYLQRIQGVDIDAVRAEIAAELGAADPSARRIHAPNYIVRRHGRRYVVRGHRLVTVTLTVK